MVRSRLGLCLKTSLVAFLVLAAFTSCGEDLAAVGAQRDTGAEAALSDGPGRDLTDTSTQASDSSEGSTDGTTTREGAPESGEASDSSAQSDGSTRSDGKADGAGMDAGGRGATACGPSGLVCTAGDVCMDLFINGNGGSSHTYSCVANPCDSSSDPQCYCQLCLGGDQCQPSSYTVVCTRAAVCASWDTPIATADGDRPIDSLRPGDLVYSADRGSLRLVPVLRVSQTAVRKHHLIEVSLANGAVLRMSAGHPTADGRLFGTLRRGETLDGLTILSSKEITYSGSSTYDIFLASDTHSYIAAGVLVGTSMVETAADLVCSAGIEPEALRQ